VKAGLARFEWRKAAGQCERQRLARVLDLKKIAAVAVSSSLQQLAHVEQDKPASACCLSMPSFLSLII